MKVILVNGSPHKNGTTSAALNEVAASLNANGIETEDFFIGAEPLMGCIGCAACVKTGKCFKHDRVNEFIEKAKTADGFIFGTPVHYAAAGGAISSFMDRAFFAKGKIYAHKPAAAVACVRRGGSTNALDQLNKYFTISEMPVVSSRYWNMVYGSDAEEAKKDEEGMQTMRILGKNMAWLLKCIDCAKKNGIPLPEPEQKLWTDFCK